jgi:hypothetical protein
MQSFASPPASPPHVPLNVKQLWLVIRRTRSQMVESSLLIYHTILLHDMSVDTASGCRDRLHEDVDPLATGMDQSRCAKRLTAVTRETWQMAFWRADGRHWDRSFISSVTRE